MDLKTLLETPPWDWPEDAGKLLLKTLVEKPANEADRLIAAELAGELVVMNDDLADALLAIVRNSDEPEELRATAAIGLGPVLEQGDLELLDDDEFDDPESVPISLDTFRNIQDSLHKLYLDESNPKEVRRRVLEGSVRSSQEWHLSATKAAYSSGDKDWVLTAVFAMGHVRGFEDQILEALESADPEIHFQAIRAAGHWELDAAWSHVVQLVENPKTPKPLLLAAIEAVGNIRPQEAVEILVDLADSRDEEIAEAANAAISMARAMLGEEDDEEEMDDGEWIN
jgi:HEAT repeat protein